MTEAASMRPLCSANSITMPGGGDVHLIAPPPKPCVTIVVHGVNDLAGCYERIEAGLCQGLNERLDLWPNLPNGMVNPGYLKPAQYTSPSDDGGKAPNPDAVYYRRKFGASSTGGATRSVVIPFYWGFREEEAHINKTEPHGEWLDRNKNRLDKAGTIEGGQFANATTNLPDMWGNGFNGKLFGFLPLDWITRQLTHPLYSSPGRYYMVLAAMRLAMLIKIIRKRYPNDTINVVGHSQGTLINLLAHAFLNDEGIAPADSVVMMNSPYSLIEPFTERFQNKNRSQQTTEARIATLSAILQFIAKKPNPYPALSGIALKNCQGYGAIGGPGWTGSTACEALIDTKKVAFDERDNRGCIYLYFTPQDQTVGFANVQGIGWQGISDKLYGQSLRTTWPLSFHQRVFTLRKRDHKKEEIGAHVPPSAYPLLLKGEKTWEDSQLPWSQKIGLVRAELEPGSRVMLAAPLLPVPVEAVFTTDGDIQKTGADSNSGLFQIKEKLAPIDAAIAVSNNAWAYDSGQYTKQEVLARDVAYKNGQDLTSIENARNEGKDTAQCAHVIRARPLGDNQVLITRSETPYEARLRLQEKHEEPLSFHSAIPNNPEHSRRVMAYDLAIGSGESVDDPVFYAYLCRVADWRLDWNRSHESIFAQAATELDLPDEDVQTLFQSDNNRSLIESTVEYRKTGTLPTAVGSNMPTLVASQTLAERDAGKPINFGGAA
ncbi:hypothetical protein BLL42_27930 (plasmid) [Pseudomonas frederiksbergensis]|uniref:DUF3274 domain-containing protein n=1 Tax=Pseudomonas frederiksbergensis TaxID=104087 RepID=A0A1J0ETR8_9PSED|nr:DUF3274 domain-containing protein [Pseudomonas frederiksbergensis]APC19549.1 hypothetical protein BLL42_27930 [Pseudomonas frederiksbergensis]